MQQQLKKIILYSMALLLFNASSACTPWVKPYQRAKLANEVMEHDRDGVSSSYMHHVRQAREGARGAEGGSGGGCGCN